MRMSILNISTSGLKEIVSDLKKKISFNHIANITIINSTDVFVTFSMYRKEKLLICLNPQHPFLSLVDIKNPCPTKVGNFSDVLRKEVKDGFITDVELLNDDRVVQISYNHTNDYFDKEERKLIIELIPHRPNLIIINNEKILYATHYTDVSNEHPIVKGFAYSLLPKPENSFIDDFDKEKFVNAANDYYLKAKHKRLEEEFKPLLKHIKSRIKTLKGKIDVLNKEMNQARENLKFQEIGQMILTYANNQEDLDNYLNDNNIDYDKSLTPGVNASKYFARYKKAKRTLEMDAYELERTSSEIDYLETCLAQSKYMNEDDIIELGNLLFPNKFKIGKKQKIESKPGEISIEDYKILYGKNAKQNEQLTFKKANRDDLFFHIKDEHGSHVIVRGDNPSNEVKLVASEIALLLSGKEEGEVQMTKVKNVKKGPNPGQALLSSHETFVIRSIRSKTKKILEN